MTTVAYQRDLLTKRWRGVRLPKLSELQIQISLVQRLRLLAPKEVVWFHYPAGELRSKKTAAKLKAMGTMAGVSDFIFFFRELQTHSLSVLFLELKSKGRKPSDVQLEFSEKALALGCYYEYADTIDGAVSILEGHGILPCQS